MTWRSGGLFPSAHQGLLLLVVVVVVVFVVVLAVALVLTLTPLIKSVITGQAPVTLELRNPPGIQIAQTKVIHVYLIAEASHASS